MAKSGGWRSYAYNCIFVVYMKKIRENIFYQGKIRELSGNFIFGFLWPPCCGMLGLNLAFLQIIMSQPMGM